MNKKQLISGTIAIFLLFIVGFVPAFAQQGSPITAVIDRNTVSTDETLLLTVTISTDTGTPERPSLPDLAGFQIVGSSRGTQISIVNGQMSSSATYQYRLQPIETGDLLIGPIAVNINGQSYATDPIPVQVTQGNAPVQGNPAQASGAAAPAELVGQDYFVEAIVDNPTPYQGEQINYIFRFYHAVNLSRQANYQPPTFTGFWSDAETEQVQYSAQEAGRMYNVNEMQTILFPTVAGELTIDPTRLTIPGGFFSNGADLMTQPVTINVQPLPPNPPATFNGAVGQYQIAADVDMTETKVNEPVTWQVTVGGYGNIATLPEPLWPEMLEWRAFDSRSTINTQVQDGRISGSQSYERVLIPTQAGVLTLPAVEYSYFDPETAEYQTISTQPIQINVAPGVNGETNTALPTVGADSTDLAAEDTAVSDSKTLRPNKLVASSSNPDPVTEKNLFWLLWLLPLVGLVGHFGYQKRQDYVASNSDLIRSQHAQKRAQKALKTAHKQKADSLTAASDILLTYLSARLNQAVQGLTHAQLATLLAHNGVNDELISNVEKILTRCEMGRYAPIQDNALQADKLLDYTKATIEQLENEFNR